jgi:hypothetical protein
MLQQKLVPPRNKNMIKSCNFAANFRIKFFLEKIPNLFRVIFAKTDLPLNILCNLQMPSILLKNKHKTTFFYSNIEYYDNVTLESKTLL